MAPARQQPKLYDLVEQARQIESKSGYWNNFNAETWRLHGSSLDVASLNEVATPEFVGRIRQIFGDLVGARQYDDNTIALWFHALRDCLHFRLRRTGTKASDLLDANVDAWREEPSGVSYPPKLKSLIQNARKQDKDAFPGISEAILKRLKVPPQVEHVINLDPDKGPWVEAEVTAQDVAIEDAYTTGVWHVEKFVLVQLLRTFGMRIGSVARMKIEDVHLPITGYERAEIRWASLKNGNEPERALFWPVSGALRKALEEYLEQRLKGIPKREWYKLPVFTPGGLPGAFRTGSTPEPSSEIGYEGHAMEATLGGRFRLAMGSLGLTSWRTGKERPMKFNPNRERHTVGTRLALKGYSAAQIALFLGHAYEGSCEAYVDLARLCM